MLLFGLLSLYVVHALLFTNVWVGIRKKAQIGQRFQANFHLEYFEIAFETQLQVLTKLRTDNLEICLFDCFSFDTCQGINKKLSRYYYN
jgi:hypothetical protein